MDYEPMKHDDMDSDTRKEIGQLKKNIDKKQNPIQKVILKAIKTAVITILAKMLPFLIGAVVIITLISGFQLILDGDAELEEVEEENLQNVGVSSIWGCSIDREEFINAAKNYNGTADYHTYLAAYAAEFYDICTSYNINPCYAYAHAFIETGGGSSSACKNNKNYFGYAHYNDASSGSAYTTVNESIEDYCKWIIDASTEGTSKYNLNYETGKKYAEANNYFKGRPDNNLYVLFSTYAYLGDTHLCDETDFDNPKGLEWYVANGSTTGTGGRYFIYYLYELGGLYEGQYKAMCGHANASDPTTIQEKADYSQYTTDLRIKQAKVIFGDNAIQSMSFFNDDIVSSAITCHKYLRENGYTYAQAGITIPDGVLNGKTIDCSSYVTWVLYCAGYENMEGYQQTSYTFSNNSWGWQEVSLEEAIPGDIVVYYESGGLHHVELYADTGTSNRIRAYNCGSNASIQSEGTTEFPETSYGGHLKTEITKILRPSK